MSEATTAKDKKSGQKETGKETPASKKEQKSDFVSQMRGARGRRSVGRK